MGRGRGGCTEYYTSGSHGPILRVGGNLQHVEAVDAVQPNWVAVDLD